MIMTFVCIPLEENRFCFTVLKYGNSSVMFDAVWMFED